MRKLYFLFPAFLLLLPAKTNAQATINVVFHVVYNTTQQNIPDSCLQHQLDVLNEDFNAGNSDLWKVPAAWVPIIGNMNVNFTLATTDPSGNPTTGIERRQYSTPSWTTNDNVKHFNTGGLDAWPDTSYLNIWVCNLAGGLLGYTQFPGGPDATDGVVLHWHNTGRGTYAQAPFNLGRAGTHEVAHWLGLKNFASNSSCVTDMDGIPDTPTYSSSSIYGGFNPFQVVTDGCNPSSPGVMWMNFMTYVDDSSMYFFTQNQIDTMTWVFNNLRQGMGNPLGLVQSHAAQHTLNVYPSPSTNGLFTLERSSAETPATIVVYNLLGDVVSENSTLAISEKTMTLDLSALPGGFYTVALVQDGMREVRRVSIVR